MPGRSNYYFGPNPSDWLTNVPNYSRVRYPEVFPGVDLEVQGANGQIEYDWLLAPGADARSIRFTIEGAKAISIAPNGDLVLATAAGEIRHSRPRVFQDGREISGQFRLRGNEVSFRIGAYDHRKPLLIDPILLVSASFGGGVSIGTTYSSYFPLVNAIESLPSPTNCEICAPGAHLLAVTAPACYAPDLSFALSIASNLVNLPVQ